VKEYTYLGTAITKKLTPENETRITNANPAYYVPLPLAKNRSVLIREK
jgi:hypothetical protein